MKHLPNAFFCSLIIFILTSCSVNPPSNSEQDKIKAVEKLLNKYNSKEAPGFVIGIAHKGKPIFVKGYGMADLEHDIPNTPETIFHIASVSKQFTAFAIALLEQDGKINLEDDIRKYLPYVPDFGHKITIRHMILHTNGIRDQVGLLELSGHRFVDIRSQKQIINLVTRQKALNFIPGTEYSYNNTTYTLLSEVVKAASGQTLREFTTERIFKPLGMNNTYFYDDVTEIVKNRAHSYYKSNKDSKWKRDILSNSNYGATNLHSTAADLLKWADNFRNPIVGDKALIKKITTMGTLDDGTPINYGYALAKNNFAGHDSIGHSGSEAGFRALITIIQEEDFTVNLTTNAGGSINKNKIVTEITKIFLGEKPTQKYPVPKAIEATDTLMNSIVGEYKDRFFNYPKTFRKTKDGVMQRGKKLIFRVDGTVDFGDDGRAAGHFLTPTHDDNGQVISLKQSKKNTGGRWITYHRVVKVTPSLADLKELEGKYHSTELDTTYELKLKDGVLTVHMVSFDDPYPLKPNIKDGFSTDWFRLKIRRNKNNEVDGFYVSMSRAVNFAFKKIS